MPIFISVWYITTKRWCIYVYWAIGNVLHMVILSCCSQRIKTTILNNLSYKAILSLGCRHERVRYCASRLLRQRLIQFSYWFGEEHSIYHIQYFNWQGNHCFIMHSHVSVQDCFHIYSILELQNNLMHTEQVEIKYKNVHWTWWIQACLCFFFNIFFCYSGIIKCTTTTFLILAARPFSQNIWSGFYKRMCDKFCSKIDNYVHVDVIDSRK